ncbi:MAG: restriction endonuclease [Deltaproteobacteria bacterium]|nr:restriction endonuclease [Deltaproteobacteria bacterium]
MDVDKIRGYSRAKLRAPWRGLQAGSDGGFPSGRAFEHLLVRAFQLDGAHVEWPYEVESPLHQIDGVVHFAGLALLLEAKHWDGNVDFAPIAKLAAHLRRRPANTMGIVFSARRFTDPARESVLLSGSCQILLWEGAEIDWAMSKQGGFTTGLVTKYRQAVKLGVPDYNIVLGGP